jgi:mannosyltransferase OCH1-like enzyme
MSIPRIIHQTAPTKGKLHDLIHDNIRRLKALNDNWDYHLYDDAECRTFIRDCYGSDMLTYFERISPLYGAARADVFRYLLLYEYGGVYLDVKSTATLPLDDVLQPNDEYLLSGWRDGSVKNEYQQWHIIASPKHPFLGAVIEAVLSNIDKYNPLTDGIGKRGVLRVTGPTAYTDAIRRIESANACRVVDIEDLGFRYSIFHRFSHQEIFHNHYSKQIEPIVYRDDYSKLARFAIKRVTQYRGLRRDVKNLIKREILDRSFSALPDRFRQQPDSGRSA